MDNSLVTLSNATRMLAEVRNIDDAKKIINLAEAARVYAKQVELGLEAQNHAAEIKLRAQRKAGEILSSIEGTQGSRTDLITFIPDGKKSKMDIYEESDISPKDAHVWQTLASIPPEMFDNFIKDKKEAIAEVTTAYVYREAKRFIAANKSDAPKLPTEKYRIIYADPPWKYGNTMPDYMGVQDDHYPLMSLDEICALPIKNIAEDNAVLFLWVTSPILEESFQVVKAWGFEYKSTFIWDKVKHVMGHYNSVRHEILLVCVRGSCQPDVHKLFDSVVSEERTEHSVKPSIFREIIDTIYPGGKRIELFARKPADGWEVWGNESNLS